MTAPKLTGATGPVGATGPTSGGTGASGIVWRDRPCPPCEGMNPILGVMLAIWVLVLTLILLDDDPKPAPARPSVGTSIPVKMPGGQEYECSVSYGTTIVFSACTAPTP